ncbi:Kinesin-like protein KIF11 [Orchesella cincta]|uniref:Kinesin-like protein KIF11 n=1 Tax=Orchesella cincta TaxID=48709 RepID=A0A1D2MMK7_ORCCI|nr:Kinesin-like protein KIF11 [Orchesella cincta]
MKHTLLDNANANNLQLKARLASTLDRVDELQHLLKAHTETEKKLAGEADVLLQTTNDTVKTIESLHARLDRKKKVEETNLKHTDRFRKNLDKLLNDAEASLEKVKERNVLQTLDYFKLEDERKPLRKNLFDECHTVVSNTFNACMRINIQFTDFIEKLEKGTSHAIADSNMNFMVAMDNSDKSASSLKESLSDMVQAAKTQFGSMKAEINNLKTLIAKEFDQLEQDIKSTLSKDVAEFARLETVMTNLMSSFKTMAEQLDTNDRCFELRQQQYKGQYQQKITDMQRTLQELLTDTDEYVGGSAKSQKELVEKFSASREDCDTMLAEELKALQIAKAVPQETANKLNHYRERNVSSHQNHLTHLHEKVEERVQSTRQLEKKVSSVVTAHNEMLQERLTSVKAHNETINGTLKLFLNNANPCQTSLHKTYEHSREAFHKMLSNVADTESVFVSELHKSVDNQLEQLSDGLDRTANEIRKINGFQNEFWDVNYLKDLPTGATPMKREYQYPTKLSATSPHERVLSRYRSVSKTIRDTLVEQDSVVSDFSSTEMCVLVGESDGKNSVEERDRQKRESEVLEREQEERRLQRLEWEEQERQRLLLHKKTQVKLKKGVPFNEVLQDLARVKSPQEKMEEKNMDALMEKEGEIDLKDKNVTKCEVPRESSLDPVQNRPFSDGVLFEVSEAKENAVPTSKAAGGPSKKRRNSGGNKKKARSK